MKNDLLFDEQKPLEIADQGCFFVGGRYVETDGRTMMGQMYVQYQVPRKRRFRYPVVMIHGGGQTGVNYLCTPDGRRGWADYFVANGFAVYVVDQPGRGRSGFYTRSYGKSANRNIDQVAERFTAPERTNPWPQAALHTQWPGQSVPGDPNFDQFYASQVESITDLASVEAMIREAGAALLDRIGPAILLGHSQGGPLIWTIADARPKLTRGILAIEPNGPPVREIVFTGPPDYFKEEGVTRPWGITRGPLTYEPAVKDPSELKFVQQAKADGPGMVRGWLQAEPARRLVNLAGIPILILTAEASYHAPYDHLTSQFLRQAGVEHDFVRLQAVGIRGNAHMMMLEKNNLEIAQFLERWLQEKVKGA